MFVWKKKNEVEIRDFVIIRGTLQNIGARIE